MTGIYIHIPFCIARCKYCDFVSSTDRTIAPSYINALINEMEEYRGMSADTVFIGGGTPTCLDSNLLSRLLSAVRNVFNLSGDVEFSIEANPKTLDKEKLRLLKEHGVNRISVGVQSFNDDELAILGRIHTASEAIETCRLISEYFDNYNIDIISSVPNQTLESFADTLSTAVSLNPTHISCYSLILEKGTKLYEIRDTLTLPSEDDERSIYDYAIRFLNSKGYKHYEISNFAIIPCRHNIKYWDCDDYLGFGLSAHSYFNSERFANTSDMMEYLSGTTKITSDQLTLGDKMSEFVILGLRKTNGISEKEFKRRFNKSISDVFGNQIDKFISYGLLEKSGDFIRFTRRGIDISNSILCEFV